MTVRLTCSAAGCGWRTSARRRGLETARAAAIGLWGLPFGASLGTGCILVVLATAGALAAGGADRRDVLYRAWAGATAAGLGVFVLCAAITTAVFSVLAGAVS